MTLMRKLSAAVEVVCIPPESSEEPFKECLLALLEFFLLFQASVICPFTHGNIN